MVICLERDAVLHMVQLMPMPLTVSCFIKIQIGTYFWAYKLKYLGAYFDSGKMIKINILPIMRTFYGSANSILCHSKYVPELTKLSLFESLALPVLMYGLDVLFLDTVQIRKLNVCWNSIYRCIFNFHRQSLLKFYS